MIERIIDRRSHDLGGGLTVGRVLPFHAQRMVGPYIFFDHLGPVDLAAGLPRELDVRPHPHIGLATVTYLYDGAITHRDSLGYEQEIRPEEVNWMISGSGITHSERFDEARAHGAHMHGIQAWVALPAEVEESAPSFHHHAGADLPTWQEPGISGRLIAGTAEGMHAAVPVESPQFYMHWQMAAGARRAIPDEYSQRAIYCAQGSVEVGGTTLQVGQMAVLSAGGSVAVVALEPAIVMVLGGEPVGERFMLWNFVSSRKERLLQAREDWMQGRMKLPDADHAEYIPFPVARVIE
jgi:redox-sensitive bicupin YhaK (pirin superfamily)